MPYAFLSLQGIRDDRRGQPCADPEANRATRMDSYECFQGLESHIDLMAAEYAQGVPLRLFLSLRVEFARIVGGGFVPPQSLSGQLEWIPTGLKLQLLRGPVTLDILQQSDGIDRLLWFPGLTRYPPTDPSKLDCLESFVLHCHSSV